MGDMFYLFIYVENALIVLAQLIDLIYLVAVLCVRRFQNVNNVLILNVFLAVACSGIFYSLYFTGSYFAEGTLYAPRWCIFLFYAYGVVGVAIQFSFITFSIHRCFTIVYCTRPFFKKQRWVVACIAIQWISQCLVSLPFVLRDPPVRIYIL